MKIKTNGIIITALALSLGLVGCAGRYTGGGSAIDDKGELAGHFNLQNISAADCDNDGQAETYRGAFDWRGADGKSFTCTVNASQISKIDGGQAFPVFGGSILGAGYFSGAVTKSKNYAPVPQTCNIVIAPAEGRYLVVTGTNVDSLQSNALNHPTAGLVDGGNISYHKENTQGVCASTPIGTPSDSVLDPFLWFIQFYFN